MTTARLAALIALLLLAVSCAKKAAPPAAASGNGTRTPPESSPSAFIPDHLRGDWVVYSHRVITDPLAGEAAGDEPAASETTPNETTPAKPAPSKTTVSEEQALSFRGRPVTFTLDYVAFGSDTCRHPEYRSAMLRADSVLATDYGATPSHFGFVGGATAIVTRTEVICGGQPWASPPGLVLDMPDGHVYLLWNGTFFQLERKGSR